MGFQDTFNTRVLPAAERAFGVSATLTHGARTTDSFTTIWEDQQYTVTDAEGFGTAVQSRDFMFAISDMTAGGLTFKPRAGDVIEITENSVAKKFEIVPIGSMPAVEEMDGGYRYKAHTTRVT